MSCRFSASKKKDVPFLKSIFHRVWLLANIQCYKLQNLDKVSMIRVVQHTDGRLGYIETWHIEKCIFVCGVLRPELLNTVVRDVILQLSSGLHNKTQTRELEN